MFDTKIAKSSTKKPKIFEYLEIVAPTLPVPIYWKDRDSTVLGANELAVKNIGGKSCSFDVFLGKKVHDFHAKQFADLIAYHDEEVMRVGEILMQEEPIIQLTTGEPKYF